MHTELVNSDKNHNTTTKFWQLELKNINVVKGDLLIAKAININAKSGDILKIVGKNGSGKTSLMRLICGFDKLKSYYQPPDYTLELTSEGIKADISVCIAWLGHEMGIKPSETAQDHLNYWIKMLSSSAVNTGAPEHDSNKLIAHKFLDKIIDQWDLRKILQIPAACLSKGQKQRIALARVMLIKKPIWVLDEPDSSLDYKGVSMLSQCMKQHSKNGGIVIYSSHSKSLPNTHQYNLD